MRRITLNGMRRPNAGGIAGPYARRYFTGRAVRIWSGEHRSYWRPGGHGYTWFPPEAWALAFEDAYAKTRHCGPEKHIVYERAVTRSMGSPNAAMRASLREGG